MAVHLRLLWLKIPPRALRYPFMYAPLILVAAPASDTEVGRRAMANAEAEDIDKKIAEPTGTF